MEHVTPIDPSSGVAIRVQNATFQWASADGPTSEAPVKGAKEKKEVTAKKSHDSLLEPFSIQDLNLEVPQGQLVGIVGPVGSGKSSLLQGVGPKG
jgi:ABC-type bacteriocin/lantibiotic exporter with double-glycine peptidase domain